MENCSESYFFLKNILEGRLSFTIWSYYYN